MYLKKIYHCILHKTDVFFCIRLFVILTSPTGVASNFFRKMTNIPLFLVSRALHDREASPQFSFVLVVSIVIRMKLLLTRFVFCFCFFFVLFFITDSLYSPLYIVFASLNL